MIVMQKGGTMKYGLTKNDILIVKNMINMTKQYPTSHYITIDNEKVTLDKLSKNLIINPNNFLNDFQHRINTFYEWSTKRNLVEIVVILTARDGHNSMPDVIRYFQQQLKQIRQLEAWRLIDKNQKAYFHIKEPHRSGTPHINIVFWLPQENVSAFLIALQKKYQSPQIYIYSSHIPASYTFTEKMKKNGKKYENNDIHGFIVKPNKSMIPYITKNIQKIAKNLQEYYDRNKPLSDLTLWYLKHKIRIFGTSQTFAPLDAYKKVRNLYTYIQFTDLVQENTIQIWKKKQQIHLITKNENEILWIKDDIQVYSENEKHDYDTTTYNKIPPPELIIIQGSLKTIQKQNGTIVYEIDKLTSQPEHNPVLNENERRLIQLMKDEVTSAIKQEIRDTQDNLKDKLEVIDNKTTKVVNNTEKLLKTHNSTGKKLDKEFLSTEDIEMLYSISKSSQKGFRNRIKDPLPYHQEKVGAKITYKKTEVDEWKERQKAK